MVQRGEHACLLLDDRHAQAESVGGFLADGIARGERAVFAAREDLLQLVRVALEPRGIQVAREVSRGALVMHDAAAAYDCAAGFEPQRMVDAVADAAEQAARDGFAGARFAGEAPGPLPLALLPSVLEYESALDRYLPARPAAALCLYERASWPPDALAALVRAHPLLLGDGAACRANASYAPRHAARVLVVEDETDALESLALLLEMMGHSVSRARDGATALAAARGLRPDVMLVDIGLPDISGYELARAVRADHSLAAVRLVALTGFGLARDREQAFASGFDAHLLKPASPDALRGVLARRDEWPPHPDCGRLNAARRV